MLQPASRALLRLTRAAPARGGCGLAWRFETSATRREVSRSMFYITALSFACSVCDGLRVGRVARARVVSCHANARNANATAAQALRFASCFRTGRSEPTEIEMGATAHVL